MRRPTLPILIMICLLFGGAALADSIPAITDVPEDVIVNGPYDEGPMLHDGPLVSGVASDASLAADVTYLYGEGIPIRLTIAVHAQEGRLGELARLEVRPQDSGVTLGLLRYAYDSIDGGQSAILTLEMDCTLGGDFIGLSDTLTLSDAGDGTLAIVSQYGALPLE